MEKPVKTTRQLKAEQTKDRLYEAAIALLDEMDFDKIKIRDIVAKAHVSIGTFYNYYTTKLGPFYETYRVADQFFIDVVEPQLIQKTVNERILCFFDYYAKYSGELTPMKMTKFLYNPDNTFFNRNSEHGMVGVLIRQINVGLENGELKDIDSAEEIADYLMIATRGLVYNWCTQNGEYNLAISTRSFVERLLKAYTVQ